jgi:hypothetical protein
MTTTEWQATEPRVPATGLSVIRATFPFRSVVLPWLVARLLVVPLLVVQAPSGVRVGNLLAMDGGWFRLIALDWYDRPYVPGGFSEYPFFPLFPAAGGGLMRLGVPSTVALAGLSWAAALIALAGARQLALAHMSPRAADLTPWVIALAPGGLTLILGYSDSFFLAGMIWAVVAVERRHWWLAGVLAAVATGSRPNGVVAVIAIVAIALTMRATRRQLVALVAPSIAVLIGWMLWLDYATGDPLVFWSSKVGWQELTLVEFVTDVVHQPLALFHVVFFALYAIAYATRVRRQPPAWIVVVALGVLPAFLLGVVGLARYAVLAFPIPLAAADVLAGRSRRLTAAVLSVSALSLMFFARFVVVRSWIP